MNCKPGDLAIVVGDRSGKQNGTLVEVIRAATPSDVVEWEPNAWFVKVLGDGMTMIDIYHQKRKYQYCSLRDSSLRPIRDNPGKDQSLDWAPVPGQKVAA